MMLAAHTVSDFLTQLGAKTPTPGGGAVAAMTGATAAALARMVVSYSLGKKNLAEHQGYLEQTGAVLDRARELFLEFADADAAAYGLLNELQKLPETDPRRIAEFPTAAEASVQVPLACAAAASDILRTCDTLLARSNRYLRSDLAIAAVLAEAAVASACWNVRVNLTTLPSTERQQEILTQIDRLLRDAATRRSIVEQGCV